MTTETANPTVRELRALAKDKPALLGHYDNGPDFARDAQELNGQGYNIYSPINPFHSEVKFTNLNSIIPGGNGAGEQFIGRRVWLPYDIDTAQKPGGDLGAAGEIAQAVEKFWANQGVTARRVFSGNGYQVLVPVDLPNDLKTKQLIQAVLGA